MSESHDLGRTGEALAARWLSAHGWTVLARNFRLGHKEVDLVARRGRVVAFVEVKTRAGPGWGHPLEAITRAKRAEIETVARAWIARHGRRTDVYRFDAIAVLRTSAGAWTLEHVEDAWRAG
ncbi:MAG TPA: YraN family protein [Longimicrobiales bacterium]